MSSLSRRHFLRSSSAFIALPALASLDFRRFVRAAEPVAPPKRMIFLGFGWGVTEDTFLPPLHQTGRDYALTPGLAPLARHKADFTLVQGLTHKLTHEAHWGSTVWLTGANRYGEPGQAFANTISADQVAASQWGKETRFASLQLNGGSSLVMADSGHGPGLSLSWDARGKPLGGIDSPAALFHRLFSKDKISVEELHARIAGERSVLDTVLENARAVSARLGNQDKIKLQEYLQGIRDIETRLTKDENWIDRPRPKAPTREPQPSLAGRDEIRAAYDILVAALQTDSTRVITYRQPVSTLLKSLDLSVGAHDMTHSQSAKEGDKVEASRLRDAAQSELLAGLLDKLKSVQEADGSRLFDHTTVVFGSNIRSVHSLENCPTLIAGGGAGVKLGHNLVLPKDTPLCNAWLTLLKGSGVTVEKHGDSTGVIKDLLA
jgi:hypothetical protein